MAYMSQEHKAEIAPVVKKILNKYGLKGSLSVRDHNSLVLTIKSGKLDFIGEYNRSESNRHGDSTGYLSVNIYHLNETYGSTAECLQELASALRGPRFFDESDISTDYFFCSHYIDIKVGKWNKPYELTK